MVVFSTKYHFIPHHYYLPLLLRFKCIFKHQQIGLYETLGVSDVFWHCMYYNPKGLLTTVLLLMMLCTNLYVLSTLQGRYPLARLHSAILSPAATDCIRLSAVVCSGLTSSFQFHSLYSFFYICGPAFSLLSSETKINTIISRHIFFRRGLLRQVLGEVYIFIWLTL